MPIGKRKSKKKADADGILKRNWPLPPASVFKCRQAIPWIDPELFHYNRSNNSSCSRNGAILMGEMPDEDSYLELDENATTTPYEYNYTDEDEPIYADPVELTGPSDRIIEYSTNPERGIDVGEYETRSIDEVTQPDSVKINPLLEISGDPGQSRNLLLSLTNEEGYGELGKIMDGMNDRKYSNQKKRKWSAFQKSSGENWKLFY